MLHMSWTRPANSPSSCHLPPTCTPMRTPALTAPGFWTVMLDTPLRPRCTTFNGFFMVVVRNDSDDLRYIRAKIGPFVQVPCCSTPPVGALRIGREHYVDSAACDAPPLFVMLKQKTPWKDLHCFARDWGPSIAGKEPGGQLPSSSPIAGPFMHKTPGQSKKEINFLEKRGYF